MIYTLKLFDKDILQFEVIDNLSEPVVRIENYSQENRKLLPLDVEPTNESLARWLKHRTIPKNRAFVNSFLSKCGLSANRPMDVISVCKGLSLNDSYWIADENETKTFDQINLYENRFSRILASIAFTGYGSSVRSSFASSPEFTTNGMLPKCWRRENNKVYLYKGGTSGASNTGNEPYSEKYAYYIGKQLGFDTIEYKLSRWKGNLCSYCELFTSKDVSYVPIGKIIETGGMKAVRLYYKKQLGDRFVSALDEMIVFDALICNTDRHLGNFGLLVDSHTNKLLGPAPLFDHGNSLFSLAGKEDWDSLEALSRYADISLPRAYEDFYEEARKCLSPSIIKKVRKALVFHFEDTDKYRYPRKKLDMLEKIIQKRAAKILDKE